METFFTSDTHFFHRNIAGPKVSKWPDGFRNFNDEFEMNQILIKNWNKRVAPNDIVYHLGDVSFGQPHNTGELLRQLHGTIHLCIGNHEKPALANRGRFASVCHYNEVTINKQKFVLFHYPIESWDHKHHGAIHLHGHTHYKLTSVGISRVDVGVDNPFSGYAPFDVDEVILLAATNLQSSIK